MKFAGQIAAALRKTGLQAESLREWQHKIKRRSVLRLYT
jgi:hypothetical protein